MKTKKNLVGKVLAPVTYRHTPGKKSFCYFVLSENGKLRGCKGFDKIADFINSLPANSSVSMHGYLKKEDEGAADVFYVEACALESDLLKGEGGVTQRYESEEDKRARREWYERQRRNGIIYYYSKNDGHVVKCRIENCVLMPDGEYIPQIIFLMDTFGGQVVTDRLRAEGFNGEFGSKEKLQRYKDFKAKWCAEGLRQMGAVKTVEEKQVVKGLYEDCPF